MKFVWLLAFDAAVAWTQRASSLLEQLAGRGNVKTPSACLALLTLLSLAAPAQQYVISTYAGGALPSVPPRGIGGPIGSPRTLATDGKGNVYFTSGDLVSVFKLDSGGALTRFAGEAPAGYAGDGGPALRARLLVNVPGMTPGLAADGFGNLFIADTGNHRIRRVSPDGIIVTVAGNGVSGFSGDGGAATSASLNTPSGLALDFAGNLFIADSGNHRIRKVSRNGTITTVAGTGAPRCSGPDACLSLGDGGPATVAVLSFPTGLATDGDAGGGVANLFIADSGNSRIRKVSTTGIITTVAGNNTRAFDSNGADSGPATGVSLDWPTGVAVDNAGNLFIADPAFQRIRKVSPSGILTRGAGTETFGFSGDGGPATSAQMRGPRSVVVDAAGNLFIADSENNRIRKTSPNGIITTVAGNGSSPSTFSGDGGAATDAQLRLAGFGSAGLAVDATGNLYIADTGNHRIRKVSATGVITTVAGAGAPCSYSMDQPPVCIPLGDGGPATSAALSYPMDVAVDAAGQLFISDTGHSRIRKVSTDGVITTLTTGTGFLSVDRAGNLFISAGIVRKVAPDGTVTVVAGGGRECDEWVGDCIPVGDGGPAIGARLNAHGTAVDAAGNLIIADNQASEIFCDHRIRRVSTIGIISTIAGGRGCGFSGDGGPAASAQLDHTLDVAADRSGNLFLTSIWNSRVRRIAPDGTISTVAGNGYGFSGDGGPATGAALTYPGGVAVDASNNVYVMDLASNVIRILRPMDRSVLLSAVVDAASQRADAISPGKIVVLHGAGLTGATVSFNGLAAPVLYTSATQVAAVVPYEVTGATAKVTVTAQGEVSNILTVPIEASAPNIFTLNQAGWGQAAAINAADGTPNTAVNPVAIGSVISLYATGEGRTDATGTARPILPVTVTIGGLPATVRYAGSAPGQSAGLIRVDVQIPDGVQPGAYVPVVLQVGDRSSNPAVWIAVAN